jgi:hypothetical protein
VRNLILGLGERLGGFIDLDAPGACHAIETPGDLAAGGHAELWPTAPPPFPASPPRLPVCRRHIGAESDPMPDLDRAAAAMGLLRNATRWRIVQVLVRHEASVTEVANALGMRPQLVT